MQELGSALHKARVQRDMSLAELEDATKIRQHYLQAIEEGNFEILPDEVYLKGFLRLYARAVDLKPEEIIRQYEYLRAPQKPAATAETRRKRARNLRRRRLLAVFVLAALVFCGLLVYLWQSSVLSSWFG